MAIVHSKKTVYYVVNGITLYRLASAPVLLLLAIAGFVDLFKWLMAFSFFTDAVDGPLARRYNAISIFGSRFDSIADDATVIVATISLWIIHPEFVKAEWKTLIMLWGLFIVQTILAFIAYGKATSFHTHLAKTAAVAQAAFFIMIFFQIGPMTEVFYLAATITGVELLEEIILVKVLPEWKTDVKGLFWVLRSKRDSHTSDKKLSL